MASRESGQPVEAEVRALFATPVVTVDLPEAPALNEALRTIILERERTVTGVQHSNLGGWQSDIDFHEWCGDAGRHLLDRASGLASRLTADRHGQPVSIDWKVVAWANVNRDGHANEFHTHPGCYWSATYYVDDGNPEGRPDIGGEFEIQDPRGVAPAMYAPLLAFATQGGLSVGASELVPPRTGRLMMFPSWLSHGVRPYHGGGIRISIAMNFSV